MSRRILSPHEKSESAAADSLAEGMPASDGMMLSLFGNHPLTELFPVTFAETMIRYPGATVSTHAHADEYQIELIIAAGGTSVLGDREIAISRHVLLVIPPGVSHSFNASGKKAMRHFTVKFCSNPQVLNALPPLCVKSGDSSFSMRIADQLRLVVEEWLLRPWGFEQTISLRIASVVLEALRNSFKPREQDEVRGLLDKACRYIAVHHGRPLAVSEVADHCELRTDSLCRLFRKHLRTSPGRYLQGVRIQHAQALLRSGYTVTECASRSGFSSIHYFSRLFHSSVGVSPKAWVMQSISKV